MNFLSYTTLAAAILFTAIGLVFGAFIYRCFLVKHPSVLNALVSRAKEDIDAVEALITQKKSVLPTAVAAPVPVAPTLPAVESKAPPMPVVAPVVAPVTVAPAAPAAQPVVAPVAVPAPVAPVFVAPVAPVAPAAPAA